MHDGRKGISHAGHEIAYYAEKARGGAAVVTIGDTPVDREHAASNPRSFCLDYTNG
ncbi:MAG: hypothetical protein ACOX7I_04550 [Oscillospiraceae bacterium]